MKQQYARYLSMRQHTATTYRIRIFFAGVLIGMVLTFLFKHA